MILFFSFQVLISYTQTTQPIFNSDFPSSWQGDWAGELLIFNADGMSKSLPMQLNIQAVEQSKNYSFTIVYGVGEEKDTRSYMLKEVDASKGHYLIDEQNSIKIDAYLLGGKLVQRFEVMGNILETFIEKRGETMVWEIFSGKTNPVHLSGETVQDGDEIPLVKSYPMSVYQKAVLSRI